MKKIITALLILCVSAGAGAQTSPNGKIKAIAKGDSIKISYRDGGKTLVVSSLTAGGADDSFAADLSVALHAEYARFGSLNRAESIAKYNQLLRLEESFG